MKRITSTTLLAGALLALSALAGSLRAGVIDHMAFSASGLKSTLAALDARSVEYVCRQQKGTGIWQVFVHDPNGAKVELDFPPEEPAPQ